MRRRRPKHRQQFFRANEAIDAANFPAQTCAMGNHDKPLMNHQTAYQDFTARFKLLISKNSHLITTTLSNIFTMRLIGNKTHGDLAEIAIAEFINQYMYDFKSIHMAAGRQTRCNAGFGQTPRMASSILTASRTAGLIIRTITSWCSCLPMP